MGPVPVGCWAPTEERTTMWGILLAVTASATWARNSDFSARKSGDWLEGGLMM